MIGKFEVFKAADDTFAFKLRADNGVVILSSHGHADKESALRDIELVRRSAAIDARFERLASTHGDPFFNLRSATGAVIGQSQVYSSIAAMENGIASVARNSPNALLVDMSPQRRQAMLR